MTTGPAGFAVVPVERDALCGVAGAVAALAEVPGAVCAGLLSGWVDVAGGLAGPLAGEFVALEGFAGGFVVVSEVLGGTTMGALGCCSRTRRECRKSA